MGVQTMFALLLAVLVSLGAEVPVGSTALRPAAYNQSLRGVATNGRDFLALWSDDRFPRPGLFAGRIDAAGRPLEPTGHRVADSGAGSLIWNGSSYLLLYTQSGTGFSYLQSLDDDGRPVGAAARVDLAVPPRSFATNGRNLLALMGTGQVWLLSFDGTVLWKELIATPGDASDVAVLPNGDYRFVALVSNQVIMATFNGTTGFMSTRMLLPHADHVGALVRGATTLVAWTDGGVAKYEIVDSGAAVQLAPDAGNASVAVGWDGHQYAVALGSRISRIAADGRLIDPAPIAMPGGPTSNVRFAATGFATLTAGDAYNGTDYDVVDHGSYSFDDLAASPVNVIASSTNPQRAPRVAAGGLTLWIENDDTLMAQQPGGTSHEIARGFIIPAVARGASSYLVTWTDFSNVLAKRVAFDGTPIDADPIVIAEAQNLPYSFTQAAAPVAFDGTNFLVVWADVSGSFYGMRVAQNGRPIDAQPLVLTTHDRFLGAAVSPRLVWTGSNYVLGWADQAYSAALSPQPPMPARMSVVRVSAAGEVLDAAPNVVWDKANVYAVGLATNGSGIELVWLAPSPIGSRHLCVFRNGNEVACSELGSYSTIPSDLDLTWTGSEYVAAWTDVATSQVKAIRFDVDDEPFVVSDNASQASIAANAGGATIAYVRIADGPPYGSVPRVFTRTIDPTPRRRATR